MVHRINLFVSFKQSPNGRVILLFQKSSFWILPTDRHFSLELFLMILFFSLFLTTAMSSYEAVTLCLGLIVNKYGPQKVTVILIKHHLMSQKTLAGLLKTCMYFFRPFSSLAFSSWGFSSINSLRSLGVPLFNPFIPNAPFLYPLKTSKNREVFWCFQGVEKGYIGNEWVNFHHYPFHYVHFRKLYQKKINLNFYFHTSLWCRKRFYEGI